MKIHILTPAIILCIFAGIASAQQTDLQKANNAFFNKQYHTAIQHYNSYLENNKGVPFILFRRGESYFHIGNYSKAVADFNEGLKLSENHLPAFLYRGIAYKQLGRYEAAIRDLTRYSERTSNEEDKVEAFRHLSDCYRLMGDDTRAESFAQMAQEYEVMHKSVFELQPDNKQPANGDNNVQLNTAQRPTGQQQQTINGSNPQRIKVSPAELLLNEARKMYEEKNFAEAVAKATRVIDNYKEYRKEALDIRGQALINLKKYAEAIRDFDQSLLLSKDAWTFNQRGIAKMESGDLEGAEKDFNSALTLDPLSAARANLATLAIRKRNTIVSGDKQGPTVTIHTPQQLAELGANSRGLGVVSVLGTHITITGMVEDPSGVREVSLNSNKATLSPSDDTGQRFMFTVTIPVSNSNGENYIYFSAKDAANNETRKTYRYVAITGIPDNAIAGDKSEARGLIGKCYALLIGIDQYLYWDKLYNPVRDVNAIAQVLKENYGFETDLLINPPDKKTIQQKLTEWSFRDYEPNDQLLVVVAAHGYFSEQQRKGYIIPREGLSPRMDLQGNTWISHDFIRNTLEHSNCRHVFLVMDACFSGTFSPAVAMRGTESINMSLREMVARKIQLKTRKYLTSGGKEYVPDGHPGAHSPFAAKFLEVLRSKGKMTGGILTIDDIRRAVQNLEPMPHSGDFPNSSSDVGSDFFFIPIRD